MGPDKLSAGVAGAVGWVTPRNYRRSRREGCVRASELNLRRFSENRTSRQTCCNSGEPDRRVLKLHTSAKFTSTFDLIRPRSRLLCTVTNDFDLIVLHSLCSVDLCFCTSGDGIDGSRRCFLEYVDSLHTTRRIILTGWRERREKRESERLVRVPVSYRGM